MADIFMSELGDVLVCNDLCIERKENKLPSPNDLKRKIILKGKIKLKKRVSQNIRHRFRSCEGDNYSIPFLTGKTILTTF